MFRCRVCEEKDKRIADLQSEVSMLRKVALPTAYSIEIPFATREVDRILGASDEPIEVTETEEQREVAALLLGSYDNSQIEVE